MNYNERSDSIIDSANAKKCKQIAKHMIDCKRQKELADEKLDSIEKSPPKPAVQVTPNTEAFDEIILPECAGYIVKGQCIPLPAISDDTQEVATHARRKQDAKEQDPKCDATQTKREKRAAYKRLYRKRKRQSPAIQAKRKSQEEVMRKREIRAAYMRYYRSRKRETDPQSPAIQAKRKAQAEYMRSYRLRQQERLNRQALASKETKSSEDKSQHSQSDLEPSCIAEADVLISKYETEECAMQDQRIPSSSTLDYCPFTPDVEIKELWPDNGFGYGQAQNDLAAILIRLEAKIDSIADDVKTLKEIACQHATTLDAITKSSNAEPQDVKPFASNLFKP